MSSLPTVAVLLIGNEILSGRTQDKNLAFIGKLLVERGLRVAEARVVPDIESVIVDTVNALRQTYDCVFTTGGIGPTHDDITAAAIARAFDVPLQRNPEAVAVMETFYGERLNEARLRMANIPQGAVLIPNPVSSAPGFSIGNVHVMAGVPKIMQAMCRHVVATLAEGPRDHFMNIEVNLPEGDFAPVLAEVQARYGDVEIGSYPYMRGPELGANIVLRCVDMEHLQKAVEDTIGRLEELGARTVVQDGYVS